MKKIGGYISSDTVEFMVHLLCISLIALMLFFILKPFDLKQGLVHYSGEYTATITDFELKRNLRGARWYYVYFTIPEFGDYEFKIEDEKFYHNSTYGDRFRINCNDLSLLPNKDGSYVVVSYNFDLKVGEK